MTGFWLRLSCHCWSLSSSRISGFKVAYQLLDMLTKYRKVKMDSYAFLGASLETIFLKCWDLETIKKCPIKQKMEWNYVAIADFYFLQYHKNYPQLSFYRFFLQDNRGLKVAYFYFCGLVAYYPVAYKKQVTSVRLGSKYSSAIL